MAQFVWEWRNPYPHANDLNAGAYGNNQFIAVGNTGTILSSPDGATWLEQTSGTSHNLKSVAYGNGQFITVGDSGTILTSSDGVNSVISFVSD